MSSLRDIMMMRIREQADQHGTHAAARPSRIQRVPKLTREYVCHSRAHAREFVNELMTLQERTHHDANIRIDGCKILIEVCTQGVGITELDEEYIAESDAIFEDCK